MSLCGSDQIHTYDENGTRKHSNIQTSIVPFLAKVLAQSSLLVNSSTQSVFLPGDRIDV